MRILGPTSFKKKNECKREMFFAPHSYKTIVQPEEHKNFPFQLSRNYDDHDHQQHMKVLFPYMSRMLFEVERVLSKLKTGICSKNSSIASCPVTQCHKHLSIMIIISTTQLKGRAI
jgi:hypothetical protein